MFVGDEDGIERIDAVLEACETTLEFFRGKSAIEQHARGRLTAGGLDDESIALATATEACKTHG
jgi:hypothetical protein